MDNVFQTLRYAALLFLLSLSAGYASDSIAKINHTQESMRPLPASQQNGMGLQYDSFTANDPVPYQSAKALETAALVSKKREGTGKAVSVIGHAILLISSMVFGALGGGALSKTGGSYDRKKGIKYIVIAFSLLAVLMLW